MRKSFKVYGIGILFATFVIDFLEIVSATINGLQGNGYFLVTNINHFGEVWLDWAVLIVAIPGILWFGREYLQWLRSK